MIDIKLVRENPRLVKDNIKKKFQNERDFTSLLKVDTEWRELKKEVDKLRSRRNEVSKRINEAKKKKKDTKNLLKEARDIPKKIQKKDIKLRSLEEKRLVLWKKIPNLIDKSVPVGDETKNKVLKKYGVIKKKKD